MVEVKNLKIAFDEKKILDGVNLTIQDGEILSIIGISGTGKSVLLKNIIGLLKPDEGAILIDGLEITQMSEAELNKYVRTKMNMVFQYGALWDSMTIEENIRLGLKYNKNYSEDKQKKIVKESLAMVGLEGIEKKYPAELSGGMNKRAGIARAIALQPKYLLYDEPTTGLDVLVQERILRELKEIKKQYDRIKEITNKFENITVYETTDYIKGEKIIDLERASGNSGGDSGES